MRISIDKEMTGEILDIGGGGEGIIGRVYGQQVTAIDNIQEELDEAPSSCKKMLMDASELEFSDETFDHVTFFFFTYVHGQADAAKRVERSETSVEERGLNQNLGCGHRFGVSRCVYC